MTPILEARDVAVAFGGIKAVRGVSLALERGELLGLIGPNGAGKTTLLRLLAGLARPDAGRIDLKGRDITGFAVDRRARAGLALTHQIVRPFRAMRTIENVMIAAGHRATASPLRALLHLRRAEAREQAAALLRRLGLEAVSDRPAGLNHAEAAALSDTIAALNRDGLTVVLVEHRLAEVVRICGRLAVLDGGSLIAAGAPAAVMARPDVRAAYLGVP